MDGRGAANQVFLAEDPIKTVATISPQTNTVKITNATVTVPSPTAAITVATVSQTKSIVTGMPTEHPMICRVDN